MQIVALNKEGVALVELVFSVRYGGVRTVGRISGGSIGL